jgi:hypothetical protein
MSEQIRNNPGYGLNPSNRCSAPICYWQGWGGQKRGAPLGLVRLLASFGTLARSGSNSEFARTEKRSRDAYFPAGSMLFDAELTAVDVKRRRPVAAAVITILALTHSRNRPQGRGDGDVAMLTTP